MDAYYGRPPRPHKRVKRGGRTVDVELTDPAEIRAYHAAHDAEDDRKDWG